MLAGRTLATLADRGLECRAVAIVELDTPPDGHVVDGNAGVLTEQVVRRLGHRDVPDHGPKHTLRGGRGFLRRKCVKALLDVGRQDLKRPDVELLGDILDGLRIDSHTQSRLSANASAQKAAAPPATASSVRCDSRCQTTNSMRSSRNPPAKCAASRDTMAISDIFTSGCAVHIR